MPHDTLTLSEDFKRQQAWERSQGRVQRKPLIRVPGMGFIGWTWACLRDLIERGEQAVYCDQCDRETDSDHRFVDGIGPLCDECERKLDQRAWANAREQRASDRQDFAEYQRR